MKVLNVAETTKGGIETYFGSLSRSKKLKNEFLAVGYDISIIDITDKKSRLKNLLTLCYILFFKVNLKSYDVIFLHSTFAGLLRILVYPYAKLFNIKVVYCSHGWAFDMEEDKKSFKNNLYIFTEKLLTHFSDIVFCISQSDLNSAYSAGLSKNKLVLNWNGVRASSVESSNETKARQTSNVKVLFVGRLDRQKGLYEFLTTIKSISHNLNKEIEFTIIGEPVRNDSPELYEVLDQAIDNVKIIQLGWVANDNLDYYFKETDFVIVPSLWEGFGLIVAEALRNGKPVFASAVGSLPFMLNSKTGWLFDAKDRASLEKNFKDVINKELYKKISSEDCLNYFYENFHEDIMNKNYLLNFEKLYA
ncbi:glycosyltransferase [Thiomicrorhabdus sp.]|uniref:glycosyltransferase n=1 Tax=Thiomicrorhabdus sp. TaxID=2039724 RepID=UPI002AA7325E|nr:glycosyltransferase [Thiomicrorhabdus sp.]